MDLFNDEGQGLEVQFSQFIRSSRMTFHNLTEGFDHARILTYSSSLSMLDHFCQRFKTIEITLGREDIVRSTADIFSSGYAVVDELRRLRLNKSAIKNKLSSGELTARIVIEQVVHQKLYLFWSDAGRRRVVTGSANLSENAWTGKQLEGWTVWDSQVPGEPNWQFFEMMNNSLDQMRTKGSIPVQASTILQEEAAGIDTNPIFVQARNHESGGAVLLENVFVAPNTIKVHIERDQKRGAFEGLKEFVRTSERVIRITKTIADKIISYEGVRASDPERGHLNTMSFDHGSQTLIVNTTKINTAPNVAAALNDARLMASLFEGFLSFQGGDPRRLQQQYFLFWSWLYISPFQADFYNRARADNEIEFDFPMFAVLYGKPDCGKTNLINTLLFSMFGPSGPMDTALLTPGQFRTLRSTSGRFPLYWDDISTVKLTAIESELKQQPSKADHPVTILSFNSEDDAVIKREIQKRAVVIFTDSCIPGDSSSRGLHQIVAKTKKGLSQEIFKLYLERLLAHPDFHQAKDSLALSSTVLCSILKDAGVSADWVAPLNFVSHVDHRHNLQKDKLWALLNQYKSSMKIIRQTNQLILPAPAMVSSMELAKLRKRLPPYLVSDSGAIGSLKLNLKETEAYLQRKLGGFFG